MEEGSALRIFTIPQQFPCGPQSSCCGPVGQSQEEIDFLLQALRKVFAGKIQVVNLLDEKAQKDHSRIVSLVSAFGFGVLPIITLDGNPVSMGMPATEEELLEVLKEGIRGG